MSVNLIEQVQQNLSYSVLQKIDPNIQKEKPVHIEDEHMFAQAAIPAVLTALYKYVQSDDGANDVVSGNLSTDWVGKIFHDNHQGAITKIKQYSTNGAEYAATKMNVIAHEAIAIMKENLPENAGIKEVKTFFLNQRNNILPYLPPELSLGEMLDDDTIDDNTNKMEGPISSLMKSIGSAFSHPVTGEEKKNF